MKHLLTLCLIGLCSLCGLSAQENHATLEQLSIEAESAFRRGMQAPTPESAKRAFRDAVTRYEQILRESTAPSGALYYNLGNGYARLDETARAILNYRRAQLYMPNDVNLLNNLAYLRTLRQDHFPAEPSSKTLKTLFFWHYDLNYQQRIALFSLILTLTALSISVMLFKRPAWLKWTGSLLTALSLSLFLSVITSYREATTRRAGVIMVPQVTPLTGDDDTYKPSMDAPIHAGTEVKILQSRGDWHQIAVTPQLTGWIKASALIEI